MRVLAVILASVASGCFLFGNGGPNLDPELFVLSPASGTSVVDHEPVTFQIQVFDVSVDKIDLVVDGTPVSPGLFSVVPQPTGERCNPCNFTIAWSALEAKEGDHVVAIDAFAAGSLKAVGTLQLGFEDMPEILGISPNADEDLLGVGTVNVTVDVLERGMATLSLTIDGAEADSSSSSECRSDGCQLEYVWDTTAIPAGMHELHVTVTDNVGNIVEDTRTVRVDDLVKVTSMELANTTDQSGTLEIEVYVFDNVTNQFLGCAGTNAGLGPVDGSGIRYAVDAQLIDTTGAGLHANDLAAHAVRFEVWEDDDNPVCPTPINPSGNDLVGTSPAKTLAQWKASPSTTFGNVTELAIVIDRPLTR